MHICCLQHQFHGPNSEQFPLGPSGCGDLLKRLWLCTGFFRGASLNFGFRTAWTSEVLKIIAQNPKMPRNYGQYRVPFLGGGAFWRSRKNRGCLKWVAELLRHVGPSNPKPKPAPRAAKVYIYIYVRTHAETHKNACVCAHIYVYVYIYICMYMCSHALGQVVHFQSVWPSAGRPERPSKERGLKAALWASQGLPGGLSAMVQVPCWNSLISSPDKIMCINI